MDPRRTPFFRAYASQLARRGVAAGRRTLAGQQALVQARPEGPTTIEVPGAQHGFDTGPDTEHGRAAVLQALDAVAGRLVEASEETASPTA